MDKILLFIFDYLLNLIFVTIAQLPWVLLKYFVTPYKRGFFCNDQSLMYPYKNSTVTNNMLTAINMAIPVITILIVELKLSGALQTFFSKKEAESTKLSFFRCAFKTLCIFFVGVGVNQSSTNMLKWVVGRLRPHFFSVCVPSYKAPCNADLYITDAECFGTNLARIKDARLSFPSGHSSSSMYALLFTALYLHFRAKKCRFQVFSALLQGGLIMLSLWIGATRISDYKHHWSDVLTGFLIGAVFAILFASCAIAGTIYPSWNKSKMFNSAPSSPNQYGGNNQQPNRCYNPTKDPLNSESALIGNNNIRNFEFNSNIKPPSFIPNTPV